MRSNGSRFTARTLALYFVHDIRHHLWDVKRMTLPIDVPLQLPQPRTPDPHEAPAIRWGIIAPGGIAHTFAEAVAVGTASQVVAVGSRSSERARDFADEFCDRHGIRQL